MEKKVSYISYCLAWSMKDFIFIFEEAIIWERGERKGNLVPTFVPQRWVINSQYQTLLLIWQMLMPWEMIWNAWCFPLIACDASHALVRNGVLVKRPLLFWMWANIRLGNLTCCNCAKASLMFFKDMSTGQLRS